MKSFTYRICLWGTTFLNVSFVCMFTRTDSSILCVCFICIWRWVHSGGWIPRDPFTHQRDARLSEFCLAQSANPLTSPASSHQPLCFLLFLFISVPLNFFSPSLFLSARLARAMLWVSHMVVCFEWSLTRSQLGSSVFPFHRLSNMCM